MIVNTTETAVAFRLLAQQGIAILKSPYKANDLETQTELVAWHSALTLFLRRAPTEVAPSLTKLLTTIRNQLRDHLRTDGTPRFFLPDSARKNVLELCIDIRDVKKWAGKTLV